MEREEDVKGRERPSSLLLLLKQLDDPKRISILGLFSYCSSGSEARVLYTYLKCIYN